MRSRRTLLALIAFAAGAAVPIQLVTLSFGYAQYVHGVARGPQLLALSHEFATVYIPFVYVPAMVLLAGIALYSRGRYSNLYRRIVVGFGMGLVATLALDTIRQMGVIHGWLPGDTPVLFGRMATGSSSFAVLWPAGLAVHYLNGPASASSTRSCGDGAAPTEARSCGPLPGPWFWSWG